MLSDGHTNHSSPSLLVVVSIRLRRRMATRTASPLLVVVCAGWPRTDLLHRMASCSSLWSIMQRSCCFLLVCVGWPHALLAPSDGHTAALLLDVSNRLRRQMATRTASLLLVGIGVPVQILFPVHPSIGQCDQHLLLTCYLVVAPD